MYRTEQYYGMFKVSRRTVDCNMADKVAEQDI